MEVRLDKAFEESFNIKKENFKLLNDVIQKANVILSQKNISGRYNLANDIDNYVLDKIRNNMKMQINELEEMRDCAKKLYKPLTSEFLDSDWR